MNRNRTFDPDTSRARAHDMGSRRKVTSKALRDAEELLARLHGSPPPIVGTLEDPAQHRELQDRRDALVVELQAAAQAGDYRRAHQIGGELLTVGGHVPARPPKSQRPRCGAMTRKGTPCQMAAYWAPGESAPRNGRCRLHGGLSTGPKTPAGREAIRESNRRRAGKREGTVS